MELHADLPDVRPQLARCGMMVVPLRIGGGSRLKILEALATNTPVVSTRVGAEGLELEPGHHLTVVEDVDDLPEAIIEAIRTPAAMESRPSAAAKRCWRVTAGTPWRTRWIAFGSTVLRGNCRRFRARLPRSNREGRPA